MRLWTRANIVLLAVLLAVLLYLVLLLSLGARALPFTTGAERTSERVTDVQAAATSEVVALLGIDYKKLDAWQKKVLGGATGAFHDELQARVENSKAVAFQAKVTAVATIRNVGINDLTSSHAVVFVGVDVTEKGTTTSSAPASGSCPAASACRQYVFKVQLDKTSSGWKVSELGFPS